MDEMSTEQLIAVEMHAIEHGEEAARDALGVKEDTLRRYRAELKKRGVDLSALRDAQKLAAMFGRDEIKTMLKSGAIDPHRHERHAVNFDGDVLRFVATGDTHFGSKYTRPEWWDAVLEEAENFGADYILHVGDLVEGMSNRAGHVYELSHIGYDSQKEHATDQLAKTDIPIYIIDGNHDRWFKKSNGALVVKDVASQLDHVTYLGHDQATINIGGVDIMLWHGEDGASYAHSYRLQKVVEALSGSDLPHILLAGHTHKMGYFRPRGVHSISTGSVQAQTGWMKSTRKEAHHGFWTVEVTIAGGRPVKVSPTWYDFGEVLA